MFKMNPDAKEFVPAHILKRRQEEKEDEERLKDVTDKLDKVDLKTEKQEKNEGTSSSCKTNESSREVQDSTQSPASNENVKPNSTSHSSPTSRHPNGLQTHENHDNDRQYVNNNNQFEGDYPEEPQDLNGEDDQFLLNAGENICEFNGEQFIVPGDDDCEPPIDRPGYDFGNAEDNEDEDVCNAFEEFLGNLPEE